MQPYPRAPDLVWPGHLHGTGCLSAPAMDTGLPSVVWLLCLGLGCVWARVSAAPRHSWLGRWGVCVFACALRSYPAIPGWAMRCGRVCLGSGFGCAPPLLAWVFGSVCACVRAPLVPRHSWLGCAMCMCVFGLSFRRQPAPLLAGVLGCVCLCAPSACTPALLAGVCRVGVCAWARVSAAPRHLWFGLCVVGVCAWARVLAAPRHSWLGCWGVCVLVCELRLYPATAGLAVRCRCVCLGSGSGCAPPLLAGVLGCACLCARSACTPQVLAGVCGVGVCAWARVSAAPRHSWLGCAAWVCVLGLGFRLRPATRGWGVGVPCVVVCVLPLYPTTPGWGVRFGRVCLGSGFGCAPPLLVGVFGCACLCVHSAYTPPFLAGVCGVGVRAWVRVSAVPRHSCLGCWGSVCACLRALLVPRHSWLGCAVWACVLGLGFWLRPATPGWGGGVCALVCALRLFPATPGWDVRCGRVCLGSGFGCAPPLLVGVCGVGVHPWAWVSAAPRHSWLGFWGVCVPVCALRLYFATLGLGVGVLCVLVCALCLYPATPSWGCAVWVCVLGPGFRLRPATPGLDVGMCVFLCALRLYPATPGWGVRCGRVCLGSGFGCAPPLLAGVLGCLCACVCAPLVPRHYWLGCAVWVCVLGLGFWAAPCHSWLGCRGVRVRVRAPLVPRHSWLGCACLGSGFAAPRHSWLGCWAVRVCVRAPLVPRHSWPGCARLCARFACTPPLLAEVCGGGVCARARVSAAPLHSWLGCWGFCVFVCALRLFPATPGWGVR